MNRCRAYNFIYNKKPFFQKEIFSFTKEILYTLTTLKKGGIYERTRIYEEGGKPGK